MGQVEWEIKVGQYTRWIGKYAIGWTNTLGRIMRSLDGAHLFLTAPSKLSGVENRLEDVGSTTVCVRSKLEAMGSTLDCVLSTLTRVRKISWVLLLVH